MSPRRSLSLLALVLAMATCAHAQDAATLTRLGWYPLPDSLFKTWGLDRDQVRRLRAIEEDYAVDRSTLMRSALPDAERERRLRAMAAERSAEIRAVIHSQHFADWERRMRASGGGQR